MASASMVRKKVTMGVEVAVDVTRERDSTTLLEERNLLWRD